MSESIRQKNLFSAEDYKKVFKAYSFIDYTSYDFDSLKQALLTYIKTYYAEDFNDYVESSEFVAIVELLAYLGTSLAFRSDMNSRENFIDTAERRESIIRLAQMVNYVPKRNLSATGLFKIVAVQTDQPLLDSSGINITDQAIYWNDPNNPDWFDQFIQVVNSGFSSASPFGRPSKTGVVGSIPTDLYQMNNVKRLSVSYQTTITVNGQQYPVDICNPDIRNQEAIFERDPDPDNAFNVLYRNDSLGAASANTGFFLYFKQGNLINVDANFDFPVPNRTFPIDIKNINQNDVFVQETDEDGVVVSRWKRVPTMSGENVIYNSIALGERNIFDVVTGADDTISVRFPDGNFGNVPTGLFRFWVRTSANQALTIKPEHAQNLQINIPYVASNNQTYTLRLVFSLAQTVSNGAASETNEQIKLRAPEVFSTQSRMVNGSDYNVLPLVYGNQIAKLRAVNRTYSGHSRYLDVTDPTGFHRNITVTGDDGAIFRDNQNVLRTVVKSRTNAGGIGSVILSEIRRTLQDPKVSLFFTDEYLPQFERTVVVTDSQGVPTTPLTINEPLYWKPSPLRHRSATGYFSRSTDTGGDPVSLVSTQGPGQGYDPLGFIRPGSVLSFQPVGSSSVGQTVATMGVIQSGLPAIITDGVAYNSVGPVELSLDVYSNSRARRVIPSIRTELNTGEVNTVLAAIDAGVSFWLYYDLLMDQWGVSSTTVTGVTPIAQDFQYPATETINGVTGLYSRWDQSPSGCLIYVDVSTSGDNTIFNIYGRGRAFVFQSTNDVRFFWEPGENVVDINTGLAFRDTIEVSAFCNTGNQIDNNTGVVSTQPGNSFLRTPVTFNVTGSYVQTDGYLDTSKVEVSPVDTNNDGVPDSPDSFSQLVSRDHRLVFQYSEDPITGYQTSSLWQTGWNQGVLGSGTTGLWVYFPVSPSDNSKLFGAPYLANRLLTGSQILDPSGVQASDPSFKFAYMDEGDLIFLDTLSQLDFDGNQWVNSISNQVAAFFNGPTPEMSLAYPWLAGTGQIKGKRDILSNYFFNKSFLINGSSVVGNSLFHALEFQSTTDVARWPTGQTVVNLLDRYHFDRNGKSFTQNTNIDQTSRYPLNFKWDHYAGQDQRVDPTPSNIVDMIVITDGYNREMNIWKNSGGSAGDQPVPPTTEELRQQFQDLDQYKMLGDSMIWNSGRFKILFGPQAELELQAVFKVVKAPSANVSDNEVKIKVVQAVDRYFDIRNWDFGEKFFYTELAAFIHQELSRVISSVVIVPSNSRSQFGNLFEISALATELFMSTATVANVEIIPNLTEQNLRI